MVNAAVCLIIDRSIWSGCIHRALWVWEHTLNKVICPVGYLGYLGLKMPLLEKSELPLNEDNKREDDNLNTFFTEMFVTLDYSSRISLSSLPLWFGCLLPIHMTLSQMIRHTTLAGVHCLYVGVRALRGVAFFPPFFLYSSCGGDLHCTMSVFSP